MHTAEEPPVESAVRRAGQKLALETGERMAGYVTDRLLRTIAEIAAGAEAAGVKREYAMACFMHLCRAVCEDLCDPVPDGESLN